MNWIRQIEVSMKLMKRVVFLIAGLLMMPMVQADVLGLWTTIDDDTGKAKSVVELYKKNGKLYGKIIDLLLKPDDSLCKECKGKLKDKPVVGMVILKGMKKEGDVYRGGKILDPGNGKTYRCKLWLEDGQLQVRGYIGPFFRTQQWTSYSDSQNPS